VYAWSGGVERCALRGGSWGSMRGLTAGDRNCILRHLRHAAVEPACAGSCGLSLLRALVAGSAVGAFQRMMRIEGT
jgi:hypothetical protein